MLHFLSLFVLMVLTGDLQPDYPVTWHVTTSRTGTNTHQLVIEAYIDEGWVIYGMNTPEGGPEATSFDFEKTESIELLGTTTEKVPAISKFEPLFDTQVLKFSQKATFLQSVNRHGTENVVKGSVRYMACDGTKCIPPTDVPFIALLK